jgi:hypothetical protein
MPKIIVTNLMHPYAVHRNSNLATQLNVKLGTMILLEDKVGENLDNLEFGGGFSDTLPFIN